MVERGPEWLRAGRIGRAHGLDGSFRVAEPRARLLEAVESVVVEGRRLGITRRAGSARAMILRLEGCEDRTAAEHLHGRELLVALADAPELEPDEWWAEELEGCAVHDGELAVGVVTRLLELPSCEVLEVARAGDGDELLVPLIADVVRRVDVERRRIEVDLGFLGGATGPGDRDT